MKLSKTTALILALATGCTAAANTVVEWSTLGNVTDSAGNNSYTQRFVVKGDTDFARLAFNQFARKMQPVNPADTLVEIVPDIMPWHRHVSRRLPVSLSQLTSQPAARCRTYAMVLTVFMS